MFSDVLVGSYLLLVSSIILVCGDIAYASKNVASISEAKRTEVAIEFSTSICYLLASIGYVYITHFGYWSKTLINLKYFESSKTNCISRYFTHSVLLISNWLFYLPVWPWAIFVFIAQNEFNSYGVPADNYKQPISLIQWTVSMCFLILIFFTLPLVVMPQLLSQHDSTGSDYIWYPWYSLACFSSCCGENRRDRVENGRLFVRKYLGSDITVAYLIFAAVSTFGVVAAGMNFFTNVVPDTDVRNGSAAWGFACSVIFMFGAWIFVFCTHPVNIVKHNYKGPHNIYYFCMRFCCCKSHDDVTSSMQTKLDENDSPEVVSKDVSKGVDDPVGIDSVKVF